MIRNAFFSLIVLSLIVASPIGTRGQDASSERNETREIVELWTGLAPGENVREPSVENPPGAATRVTIPYLIICRPEKQTSDSCVLIFPGGGFTACYYDDGGIAHARFWNSTGRFSAVLVYRTPRPKSGPIYLPALQDAQRAIRYLRANADKYGIDPDKIGAQGFSAGGCLALIAATNSTARSYEPIDELDRTSAKLAFSIPVYPAYVLDDGATSANKNGGDGASILSDYLFDEQTPPTCFLHGDADGYSSLGSIEAYKRLRKMGISAELHIFALAPHGFPNWKTPNTFGWRERCRAWVEKMGF